MNLKRLQAFRAVLELGSVTGAAQRLHTTQPAVSRLIGDLEKELGLAHFVRERQRLVPTAEGRLFFREVEPALAAVERIVDVARDIRSMEGAHLRVVAGLVTAFGIVPAATKALFELHPKVRISIAIKDVREMVDWVATGPFDVGITRLPLEDPRVECEPLGTCRCVLVVPPSHRLARKRVVSLRDLRGERIIMASEGSVHRDLIEGAFSLAAEVYSGSIDVPSGLSACQLVAEGLGVAVVNPYAFRAAAGLNLVSRPIRPAIEFTLGLFFPINRPRSNLVKAFVAAARSAMVLPR
jgi:DNA-binding transcriptional LysR family regulator